MRIVIAEWAVGSGRWLLMLATPLYAVVAAGSLLSLFAWRSRRALAGVATVGQIAASAGLSIFSIGHCFGASLGWGTLLVLIVLPPLIYPAALLDLAFDHAWSTIAFLLLHYLAFVALQRVRRWLWLTHEERRDREAQPFLPGLEPPSKTWS
jgi:hypothetical protein